MGWNKVVFKQNNIPKSLLAFNGKDFYFVHSYRYFCKNEADIAAIASYGEDFPAIIIKDNIWGVQFHPEKSSTEGLSFLKQFLLV